jgi:hypothetical protein
MKPKILSDEQIEKIWTAVYASKNSEADSLVVTGEIDNAIAVAQAQLDADVAYYEQKIREIFEEFLEHGIEAVLHGEKWYEDLKFKYGGQKK